MSHHLTALTTKEIGLFRLVRTLLAILLAALVAGCQTTGGSHPEPLRAIDRKVDLGRFMGDWYVIAHIPAFIEDEAHNAVESYRLDMG